MDFKIYKNLIVIILNLFNCNCVLSFEHTVFGYADITTKLKFPFKSFLQNCILPGTKWCGPGNIAKSDDDLGIWRETDKCCRRHDKCPDIIEGYHSKYGLQNTGQFTRLHCDCEMEFYNCLRNVHRITALAVGKFYFAIRRYCYRQDYPILWCSKYQGQFLKLRCLWYRLDDTKPKMWQWFDMPLLLEWFN